MAGKWIDNPNGPLIVLRWLYAARTEKEGSFYEHLTRNPQRRNPHFDGGEAEPTLGYAASHPHIRFSGTFTITIKYYDD